MTSAHALQNTQYYSLKTNGMVSDYKVTYAFSHYDHLYSAPSKSPSSDKRFTSRRPLTGLFEGPGRQEFWAWWSIGRFDTFLRPRGRMFESRSRRYIGTLGKSFTHSCSRRFGVKFRYSIRAVSGAPLSSSGLEEAL